MKNNISKLVVAASAVAVSASLQAGEVMSAPAPASVSNCPWGVGIEALLLKAHSNEDNFDRQDNEFAYRIDLSYKAGDNLGLRLRYFDYDGTGDGPEIAAWDLEAFDTFTLGNWNGEFAAGLRHAKYQEDDGDDVDFTGWGPTVGVELSREIVGPLAFYAGVRTSLVYGDDDANYDNSFVAVAELNMGLQYNFTIMNSCQSYLRLGIEAQNWASISDDDNEDTALFGGALKVGFSF